jgi:hypothetical protein
MPIEHLLERADLTMAHTLLAVTGGFLCIYLMQLTWGDEESQRDNFLIRHGRRIAYAALAMALFWSCIYSENKGWQPWPPQLGIEAALDLMLAVRIAAIRFNQRARQLIPF